jgi:hypothetical protein
MSVVAHLPVFTRRRMAATGLALIALMVPALAGCSSGGDEATPATSTSTTADGAEPVVRTRLGQTQPATAPGQTLYLEEVRIAQGARLSTHFHNGTQVARVISGTLTYNIVSGPVTVLRSDGDEVVSGPAVVELGPGDGVVETDAVIHYGANDGTEPVVILLTALLADGAPMATTVDEPTGA